MNSETDSADEDTSNCSQLQMAIAHNDLQLLDQIISKSPTKLECDCCDGLTPLLYATQVLQEDALKHLIKLGANVNATTPKTHRCAISIAAYQNWATGVKILIRHGANSMIPDTEGRMPLHVSTYNTDQGILQALVTAIKPEQVNVKDKEGMTALHWACFHQRPANAQILLQHGAYYPAVDIDGKTALHWAAQKGSFECCQLLLQFSSQQSAARGGAKPKDKDKAAPLTQIPDRLGKLPIHLAAAAGFPDIVRILAEANSATLRSGDVDKRTALHWAAASNQSSCVVALLRAGAATDQRDVNGRTALDYAEQCKHHECVQVLKTTDWSEFANDDDLMAAPSGAGRLGRLDRTGSATGARTDSGKQAAILQEGKDQLLANIDKQSAIESAREILALQQRHVDVQKPNPAGSSLGPLKGPLMPLPRIDVSDGQLNGVVEPSQSPTEVSLSGDCNDEGGQQGKKKKQRPKHKHGSQKQSNKSTPREGDTLPDLDVEPGEHAKELGKNLRSLLP